jgi:formamidopyrimidine-DNA glycosylase
MYQARLHPEQYSNTFSDTQVKQLHDAMMFVCKTAVEVNADSSKFPEDWLMKHRWGKGKKDGGKLPNGAKITFLKVGGRTSAVVPSVQKKTGAVAGDIVEGANGAEESKGATKPEKAGKRKTKASKMEEDEEEDANTEEEEESSVSKRQKTAANGTAKKGKKLKDEQTKSEESGRRRSGRLSRG